LKNKANASWLCFALTLKPGTGILLEPGAAPFILSGRYAIPLSRPSAFAGARRGAAQGKAQNRK
jgi:hypothetical protein